MINFDTIQENNEQPNAQSNRLDINKLTNSQPGGILLHQAYYMYLGERRYFTREILRHTHDGYIRAANNTLACTQLSILEDIINNWFDNEILEIDRDEVILSTETCFAPGKIYVDYN